MTNSEPIIENQLGIRLTAWHRCAGEGRGYKLLDSGNFPRQLSLDCRFAPISAAGLRKLGIDQLKRLEVLLVGNTEMDGEALAEFRILSQLKKLDIAELPNASKVLSAIKGSKNLVSLTADTNHLSDRDLALIATLSNLKSLDISYVNNYTAAGIGQLRALPLETLLMKEVRLDSSMLQALKQFKTLRNMTLTGSSITASERKKWKENLPNCKISWSVGKRLEWIEDYKASDLSTPGHDDLDLKN